MGYWPESGLSIEWYQNLRLLNNSEDQRLFLEDCWLRISTYIRITHATVHAVYGSMQHAHGMAHDSGRPGCVTWIPRRYTWG